MGCGDCIEGCECDGGSSLCQRVGWSVGECTSRLRYSRNGASLFLPVLWLRGICQILDLWFLGLCEPMACHVKDDEHHFVWQRREWAGELKGANHHQHKHSVLKVLWRVMVHWNTPRPICTAQQMQLVRLGTRRSAQRNIRVDRAL
jgi:hypothetical protein